MAQSLKKQLEMARLIARSARSDRDHPERAQAEIERLKTRIKEMQEDLAKKEERLASIDEVADAAFARVKGLQDRMVADLQRMRRFIDESS